MTLGQSVYHKQKGTKNEQSSLHGMFQTPGKQLLSCKVGEGKGIFLGGERSEESLKGQGVHKRTLEQEF